jgi:MFS family permease
MAAICHPASAGHRGHRIVDQERLVNYLSIPPSHLDAVAHAGLGLAAGVGSAFFTVMAVRLGASPWLLALIISAPYLTNLLAPFWAEQSRRFGTRWLVVVSLGTAAIVLLLLGMAHSPLSFTLLVMLYYLFYGVSDPLYVAMAEVVYPERTGASLGRVGAIFNSAHTLATGVAGWLMDIWGVRPGMVIAALSTGIAAAAYVPFPDVLQREAGEATSPWHFVRKDSILRHMLLVFMVAGTGMIMILPALPLIEAAQLQLSNTQIGLLLAVNGLGTHPRLRESGVIWAKSWSAARFSFNGGWLVILGMRSALRFWQDRSRFCWSPTFCVASGGAAISSRLATLCDSPGCLRDGGSGWAALCSPVGCGGCTPPPSERCCSSLCNTWCTLSQRGSADCGGDLHAESGAVSSDRGQSSRISLMAEIRREGRRT